MILGVLADRQKDSVIEFLRSIPECLSQTIHTVCCDMWEGYTEAVREELQGVRIVIDRFHVAKSYHAAADSLRKQELKRLRSELTEEEYQQLKGSMWAFRKKPGELKSEEYQALKCLFAHAPKLKLAYDLREQLTAIFEQALSKSEAQQKIRSWIKRVKRSELKCFNDFLNTLEHWWEEITNYFVQVRQRLCGRLQQQAQSAEKALLWFVQPGAPFPAYLPGSGRLSPVRDDPSLRQSGAFTKSLAA